MKFRSVFIITKPEFFKILSNSFMCLLYSAMNSSKYSCDIFIHSTKRNCRGWGFFYGTHHYCKRLLSSLRVTLKCVRCLATAFSMAIVLLNWFPTDAKWCHHKYVHSAYISFIQNPLFAFFSLEGWRVTPAICYSSVTNHGTINYQNL